MSIFIWEPATDGKRTPADAAEFIQNMLARGLAVTVAVKVPVRYKPYVLVCFVLFRSVVCVANVVLAGCQLSDRCCCLIYTNRWREELSYFLIWTRVGRKEERLLRSDLVSDTSTVLRCEEQTPETVFRPGPMEMKQRFGFKHKTHTMWRQCGYFGGKCFRSCFYSFLIWGFDVLAASTFPFLQVFLVMVVRGSLNWNLHLP